MRFSNSDSQGALPLHREWLQQAVLARAIPAIGLEEYIAGPEKFEACSFAARWPVDPIMAAALKEAGRPALPIRPTWLPPPATATTSKTN